jgi:nitric oxide reductase NorE protein
MELANQTATSGRESAGPAAGVTSRETRVPGEPGFWILILGDLTAFALLFCVFVYYRGQDIDLYFDSQLRLNRALGALNVALLLTSSWCVVQGVEAYRARVAQRARRCFGAGLLLGAGFVAVKVLEYGEKVRDGIVASTNEFFMFFYVLTGIHLLHLVIGLGVLAWMRSKSRGEWSSHRDVALVECGGVYWHMVDLLWVALFALLYLLR